MNILYIANGFPEAHNISSGVFNYHRYKKLKDLGHNVIICKINHIRENGWKKSYNLEFLDLPELDVMYINYLQVPKLNFYIGLVSKLSRIVKENSIDIVHVHYATQSFAAYLLKKKTGTPYVITSHGSGVSVNMLNALYAKKTKKAFLFADAVMYVSKDLQKLAHNSDLHNLNEYITYNGVDFTLNPINRKIENDNLNKICFVGNLIDIKRSQYLPEIFRSIKDKYPSAEFTIIGNGENRELIKEKLSVLELNSCVNLLTDTIPQIELFKILSNNDLLILPSKYEAFGCVLIEAMMCGCQVVVSENGGMPEVVGDFGSIVPDSEAWINDFSSAVVYRLSNPVGYEKLKLRAKEFSWENTVKMEESIYKRCLTK
ncbi:glycosyltransferase family 4 protein [Thiospirochaeta perfilievii]|uniref:Glycosyltransferase family 4 protein n=1 Tax=Thiospirochaeta perfilievii TaxID=252967 RepID=A0A5C1QE72_9SPIO|nr:glycosyltransferase [Thiospirochaeta perfilievii]QEN05678.1 glycosyltransferase family 4 protein [Thiospirochaeta perfilievii]